jgi:insertion element IS1 protein InsB
LPEHPHGQLVTYKQHVRMQRREVDADEMASFVQKNAPKPWIWSAMDAPTRHVMALHVGDRSRARAKHLWAKISHAYRPHATFSTDHSVVYPSVIPPAQHRAISTLVRTTNPIGRFNTTVHQRVSRLVRDALSFSHKLAHHSGAMQLFLYQDNLTSTPASSEYDMECTPPGAVPRHGEGVGAAATSRADGRVVCSST